MTRTHYFYCRTPRSYQKQNQIEGCLLCVNQASQGVYTQNTIFLILPLLRKNTLLERRLYMGKSPGLRHLLRGTVLGSQLYGGTLMQRHLYRGTLLERHLYQGILLDRHHMGPLCWRGKCEGALFWWDTGKRSICLTFVCFGGILLGGTPLRGVLM